jgi:hypothetical protein
MRFQVDANGHPEVKTKDSIVSTNQTHEIPQLIEVFANLSIHNAQDETNAGGVMPSGLDDYPRVFNEGTFARRTGWRVSLTLEKITGRSISKNHTLRPSSQFPPLSVIWSK